MNLTGYKIKRRRNFENLKFSQIKKAAFGQSGFLDGQVFLDQAAFFLQPEALKRFYHFYYYQVTVTVTVLARDLFNCL